MTAPFPRWEWWGWLICGGLLGFLASSQDGEIGDNQTSSIAYYSRGRTFSREAAIKILAENVNGPADQSFAGISEACNYKDPNTRSEVLMNYGLRTTT